MFFRSNGPGDLIFLTWRPDGPSPTSTEVDEGYGIMAETLECADAIPLLERVFCEIDAVDFCLEARSRSPARLWPVPPSVVEGAPCEGSGLAGIHIVGVRPGHQQEPRIVTYDDSPCGLEVAGSEALYLALSDVGRLLPEENGRPPDQETRETIHLAERLLAEREWSFLDVRRTWFYLHDILDWYGEFNLARNHEFDRMGLSRVTSDATLPASTGIFGHNPRGGWCVLDLLAVRSPNGRAADVRRLCNPRQSEAPEYGSAFSRGLALTTKESRYLFVSGTASIDDLGRSVHLNDFESQTERTLDAVAALIEVGGGDIDHICQATAFVKRRKDIATLKNILDRRGIERLPVICAVGDVCRKELLFELDATAVVPKSGG
jgi:enamine deaminase RidA (YjgF/YER057c/UK114 family)